ncbi:MAG TPA: response regulator [Methylothermaceae bacterium]|nr:response regulator [Methylothermaceae bacterium]
MITVLVADDHELVRSGIEHILNIDPEITVVGTAATGEEALKLVETLRPDIVIMDVNMPGIGGLAACQKLKHHHPEIRLIALSVYTDGPIPKQLLEAGVDGYISKHCPPQEMIKAVKSVYRGKRYLSQDVASQLAFAHTEKHASPFDRLSAREMEVTLLTLQGKSIQEIANILSVSPKTVCTYRYRIFEKLGIRNDVELTRLAAKYGLLNPNSN